MHLHSHLGKYKNKYKGKKVLLLAPGPSINNFKNEFNNEYYYAGLNGIIVHEQFRNLDFYFWGGDLDIPKHPTPSYHYVIENYNKLPEKTIKYACCLSDYNDIYPPLKVVTQISVENAKKMGFNPLSQGINIKNGNDILFPDISKNQVDCDSVVFQAMQILLYMGFETIILVGVDCGGMHSYKNLVDKDITDWNPNKPVKFLIDRWIKMKIWTKKYYPNTNIYSINPVNLKNIFPEYKY